MIASHKSAIDITMTPIKSKFGDVLESAEKKDLLYKLLTKSGNYNWSERPP